MKQTRTSQWPGPRWLPIVHLHGVDYFVELEPFRTYILGLFPVQHSGVAFYVLAGQAQFSRLVLRDAGLKAGLLDEGEMA